MSNSSVFKFAESNLSKDDFIAMLNQHPNSLAPVQNDMSAYVVATLSPNVPTYPTYFLLKDLNGQQYILEDTPISGKSTIFHVTQTQGDVDLKVFLNDLIFLDLNSGTMAIEPAEQDMIRKVYGLGSAYYVIDGIIH